MVHTSALSKHMYEDKARTYFFNIYSMQMLDLVLLVNYKPVAHLTHYTVTHIDIGGHRSMVLFCLIKS